jgi:hypothetical protein
MSYLQQFLMAAKRACDWGVGYTQSSNNENWKRVEDVQEENGFHMAMKQIRTDLIPYCVMDLYHAKGGYEFFNSGCHTAAMTIDRMLSYCFQETTGHPFPQTFLTFGAVYYDGLNVYNVTEDSMHQIMKKGFELSELNLHCWLTLADMFVLDISLLGSLQQKGIINEHLTDKTAFIIQDGNLKRKIRYEPILVSESFVNHIDRIIAI